MHPGASRRRAATTSSTPRPPTPWASRRNTLRGIRDRYRQAYIDEMARWEDLDRGPRGARASRRARDGGARRRLDRVLGWRRDGRRGGRRGRPAPRRRGPTPRNRAAPWAATRPSCRGSSSPSATSRRRGCSSSAATRRSSPTRPSRGSPPSSRCGSSRRRRASGSGSPRRSTTDRRRRSRTRSSRWSSSTASSSPTRDMARTELRFLRELLRRELGDVRTLHRPAAAAGARGARAGRLDRRHRRQPGRAVGPAHHHASSRHRPTASTEAAQTVVLRVVQEALQNVRKHAGATNVVVATMLDGWRMGAGGPRRRSRVRYRSGGGARPSQLRAPVHARAGRARRRTVSRFVRGQRRARSSGWRFR